LQSEDESIIDAEFQSKPPPTASLSGWKILRAVAYGRLVMSGILICIYFVNAPPLDRLITLSLTFGEFYIMKKHLHNKFGKCFIAIEGGVVILAMLVFTYVLATTGP
jgi:hypothetical protein